MKAAKSFFLSVFLICSVSKAGAIITPSTNAKEVLRKVSQKLNTLKAVSYDYSRELNYKSENIFNQLSGAVRIDFSSPDSLLGFRYFIENDHSRLVFNGAEQFSTNKKDKTIEVNNNPTRQNFSSLSFFYNSILTLKNALPSILTSEEITEELKDTILNQISYHLVKLRLQGKILQHLGAIAPLTSKRSITYKVIIDKNTYLPLGIILLNNVNDDSATTWFKNINTKPLNVSDKLWFYSTYMDEYKLIKAEKLKLIKVGDAAPDSAYYPDALKSSIGAGKLVLLEFWIKNCGYCIAAVPKLNSLMEKYKGKNLRILAVNAHDNREEIELFTKSHDVQFEIIADGKQITKDFGVAAFPTVILVNKGKVIYTGPIDSVDLESSIRDNIF